MKLKYKKIILLTTMSTMGIGILTLSVSQDRPKAEENLSAKTTLSSEILTEDSNTEEAGLMKDAQGLAAVPTEAATPTPEPSPTPIPIYPIEKAGTYPEIDTLFDQYYEAKNNRDIETLKSILSDPSKVETEEQLQTKTEYIDDYRNIKTYTKKGIEEGTYIVYVYHEIKFTSIITPAPGLAKFYVVIGEDNKPRIYSGEMDEETKVYFDARNADEDVITLIKMTDEKSKKAIEDDQDLQSFWESIDKITATSENIKAEGDTAE